MQLGKNVLALQPQYDIKLDSRRGGQGIKYSRSSDSADSISSVPSLVWIANRTIFPKFPDLVRTGNHSWPAEDYQIIEEVVNLRSDLDFELNTQNEKQCLQC